MPHEDGEPQQPLLSTDFYLVYEPARNKTESLVNLYCLAHVRKHFVQAIDTNPSNCV